MLKEGELDEVGRKKNKKKMLPVLVWMPRIHRQQLPSPSGRCEEREGQWTVVELHHRDAPSSTCRPATRPGPPEKKKCGEVNYLKGLWSGALI